MQSLGSPPTELLHTDLPPAPAFAKPATVPEPRLGANEPQEVIAHRERAGRLYNARVITCGTLWYETVRNVHAEKADASELARIEAECVKNPAVPAAKKKAAPRAATS